MQIRDEDNTVCFVGTLAKVLVQNSVHLRVSCLSVPYSPSIFRVRLPLIIVPVKFSIHDKSLIKYPFSCQRASISEYQQLAYYIEQA